VFVYTLVSYVLLSILFITISTFTLQTGSKTPIQLSLKLFLYLGKVTHSENKAKYGAYSGMDATTNQIQSYGGDPLFAEIQLRVGLEQGSSKMWYLSLRSL
jgi:hypothetical protein